MRGAVLHEIGGTLEVTDDLSLREPEFGEVRVLLRSSGVCHSDLSQQNGTLGVVVPVVLGHEGAGEIVAIGPGVTGLNEGDHVILSWIPPCGTCRLCLGGQPNLCTTIRQARASAPSPLRTPAGPVAQGLGVGAFAEQTVVPAASAIPIDHDVPFDIASLIGCGVMTGVGAVINTTRVEPGSSVAVIGCGGVGLNVVQGARLSGATTILAVDNVDSKMELAKYFGATHAVDGNQLQDALQELTDGIGFDYVFEVVGRSQTIRLAWDATRRGGTTVVVGAGSASDTIAFSAAELFSGERKLLGCLYGSADVRTDFDLILRLWRTGHLDLTALVSQHIRLDDVNAAFHAMEGGEVVRSVIEL